MNTLSEKYGLNSRVKLEQLAENHIGIIKRIKSRIIQKDAQKIIEIVEAIQQKESDMKISLICNNNICSKSVALLKENGIEVIL
ncbi:MAG: hypothetical protein JEZ09_15385 [Salinivirgaceae bacterium]|nr:hypothetical protein [Salinivirgaceae bacterium]